MRKFGIVMSGLLLLNIIIAGQWAYRYYTAEIRGAVDAKEYIESKEHRLYNYEYFYDLYAAHNAYKDQLAAQEYNLDRVSSDRERDRILANIAGIKGQMARVREEYNANARKVKTKAKFLGADLPQRLMN